MENGREGMDVMTVGEHEAASNMLAMVLERGFTVGATVLGVTSLGTAPHGVPSPPQ